MRCRPVAHAVESLVFSVLVKGVAEATVARRAREKPKRLLALKDMIDMVVLVV